MKFGEWLGDCSFDFLLLATCQNFSLFRRKPESSTSDNEHIRQAVVFV